MTAEQLRATAKELNWDRLAFFSGGLVKSGRVYTPETVQLIWIPVDICTVAALFAVDATIIESDLKKTSN